MNDQEKREAFATFLAARKYSLEPSAGLADKVMASVKEWERNRTSPGLKRDRKFTEWLSFLNRILFGSVGVRSALAMAVLIFIAIPVTIQYFKLGDAHIVNNQLDYTRTKGGSFQLNFLLKRGDQIKPASSGGLFLPGDRLQAIYSSPYNGYLQLLSLSSTGKITCISCQAVSEKLIAGQSKSLPYALELDSGIAEEAMIAVLTENPLAKNISAQALSLAWKNSAHDFKKLRTLLNGLLPLDANVSVFIIKKIGGEKNI